MHVCVCVRVDGWVYDVLCPDHRVTHSITSVCAGFIVQVTDFEAEKETEVDAHTLQQVRSHNDSTHNDCDGIPSCAHIVAAVDQCMMFSIRALLYPD